MPTRLIGRRDLGQEGVALQCQNLTLIRSRQCAVMVVSRVTEQVFGVAEPAAGQVEAGKCWEVGARRKVGGNRDEGGRGGPRAGGSLGAICISIAAGNGMKSGRSLWLCVCDQLGAEDAYEGQVTVLPFVIQSVADHELIWDCKAHVVKRDIH